MKYIVVNVINSDFDCTGHESGIVMCSTGDNTPWLITDGTIFKNKEDAWNFADKVYNEKFDELTLGQNLNDGWHLAREGRNTISVYKAEDALFSGEWVFKVEVLEIKE